MQRTVPLVIVFALGIFFIIQYFIPSHPSQVVFNTMIDWDIAMGVFALVIAIDSSVRHHFTKIARRQPQWGYSLVFILAALLMAVTGLAGGTGEGSFYMKLFWYIQSPMQTTMFGILGFYMASAAYRAFRAKSMQATLLLASAFIVMLGLIPAGAAVWKGMPRLSEWLMQVPNMASKRGITFGIGLGATATSLKIILGIERNWLGGT